jgi:uncharacterized membrane protein
MTDESEHQETCEACRTIDRADGIEDGKLYRSFAPDLRAKHQFRRGVAHAQHRVADAISAFAGSIPFIYVHVLWFTLWVAINLGALGRAREFDPFPFGLLTMVVSLEAIFLSTFILITQNRQEAKSELRAEFDFRNNVRGEIWAAHIGQALGLDAQHVEEVVRRTVQSYVSEAKAQEQ